LRKAAEAWARPSRYRGSKIDRVAPLGTAFRSRAGTGGSPALRLKVGSVVVVAPKIYRNGGLLDFCEDVPVIGLL